MILEKKTTSEVTLYNYQVDMQLTTFDANPVYQHTEIFDDENLLIGRKKAFEYYYQMRQALAQRKTFFGKKIHSPEGFEIGKHAALSITLGLAQSTNSTNSLFYVLGEEDIDSLEAQDLEFALFSDTLNELNYQNTILSSKFKIPVLTYPYLDGRTRTILVQAEDGIGSLFKG